MNAPSSLRGMVHRRKSAPQCPGGFCRPSGSGHVRTVRKRRAVLRSDSNNGHPPTPPDPLPTLNNAVAVRDTVARLIADVYSGRVHPRIAAGLAPLMHLQVRLLQTTELEQRLAEVERQLQAVLGEGRQHSDE